MINWSTYNLDCKYVTARKAGNYLLAKKSTWRGWDNWIPGYWLWAWFVLFECRGFRVFEYRVSVRSGMIVVSQRGWVINRFDKERDLAKEVPHSSLSLFPHSFSSLQLDNDKSTLCLLLARWVSSCPSSTDHQGGPWHTRLLINKLHGWGARKGIILTCRNHAIAWIARRLVQSPCYDLGQPKNNVS